MDNLIEWLPKNIPPERRNHASCTATTASTTPSSIRASRASSRVLDWELSTLGHPLADFAYHCMSWRIPPGQFRGIAGLDLAELGIPAEAEYVRAYCKRDGREPSTRALGLLPGVQPVPHRRDPAGHR